MFPRCCCRHRGPPRTAATRINPDTIYVQLHSGTGGGGQAQRWTTPASWAGRRITAVTITPSGREEGRPHLSVEGPVLVLVVAPGRPVVLSA